jgi:hypothetical protein
VSCLVFIHIYLSLVMLSRAESPQTHTWHSTTHPDVCVKVKQFPPKSLGEPADTSFLIGLAGVA